MSELQVEFGLKIDVNEMARLLSPAQIIALQEGIGQVLAASKDTPKDAAIDTVPLSQTSCGA